MKYGSEIIVSIATYLRNGNNRTDATTLADISYETFCVWMRERPEFAEAVKKAEAECKGRNIAIIQKAALTSWQAAAWWLERKHSAEFALKRDDLKSPDDVPQKMAERAAELLKKMEGDRV